jgi:hypothetical protein
MNILAVAYIAHEKSGASWCDFHEEIRAMLEMGHANKR